MEKFFDKYNNFSVSPPKYNPLLILKCPSTTCVKLLSYWQCIETFTLLLFTSQITQRNSTNVTKTSRLMRQEK
jgi:hypothetical protein